MAIEVENLCSGPATLYYAVFGTTEPDPEAVADDPGVDWVDVGMTADGTPILIEVDQTYTEFGAEQVVEDIAGRLTKRVVQVTATLQEATLQNMKLALNQLATISSGTGYTRLTPNSASSASQPTYTALIIDGWAPTAGSSANSLRRRTIVRKTLSSSKVDLEWEKSKPVTYATTWKGFYVSDSVSSYDIIDATS